MERILERLAGAELVSGSAAGGYALARPADRIPLRGAVTWTWTLPAGCAKLAD